MAKLEDLIKQIPDAKLRDDIAREAAALKATKKFGLVFEDHIPEQVQLPNLAPQAGARVIKRGNGKQTFQVLEIKGKNARLLPEPHGEEETTKLDELVVVKNFGEPIYPTLTPRERVERAPDKPWHTIINADNFHALQLLLYCYEGMVDVIYIDPPYNTGARDWKYNNDYVDASDEWKHSKWLSFMQKRLVLAKRLLKPETGVLIVTIDEHEVSHLGLLLENLFPEYYRQMVTIVVNPKGVTQGRFSRVEEYAFFCFASNAYVVGYGNDLLSLEPEEDSENNAPRWKGLLRSGDAARREDRKDMFFPVLIDEERGAIVDAGEPLPFELQPDFNTKINGLTPVWPVRTDGTLGRWGVGPTTLRALIDKGYVFLGAFDNKRNTYGISYLSKKLQSQILSGVIEVIGFDKRRNVVDVRYVDEAERQIKAVWHRTTHDAGAYGSDLLKQILGEARLFDFPKSLYAVKDSLGAIVKNNKSALILDFFSGSGTTLQATALLNSDDDGNRRCILVTNNEVKEKQAKELNGQSVFSGQPEFEKYGICESITWPRSKYVVNGKRDDGTKLSGTYLNGREMNEGFEENIEYFRLDFLDPHDVAIGEKFEAILPILWMMAGAQGKRESDKGEKGWFIPKKSSFAVLVDEHAFTQFKKAIAKRSDLTHIFIVTDSLEAYQKMIAQLPEHVKTKMLYKSYLDNFKINTEGTI
jgi:adenine-specific DNA-methyltransferase